jgi:ATP-dependent DNA helicase RecQ
VQDIHDILKEHWGFDAFRPLQEEIIRSVMEGKDTLALLPTGGGKSICFQVPAMAMDGICIVVSPLIALMQDQVDNLKRCSIKAIAITSAMGKREIDAAFDSCVYGKIKFLYLSPERLHTELARVRIAKMKVNLFAIDEAHCISQWGYDFRPPYVQIAEIRELHPKVPVLALTATATPRVVEDIQDKLLFKTRNVFRTSFGRSNLAYVVKETDDKNNTVFRLTQQVPGSGIVYVRNRRRTQEIAQFLSKFKVPSTFYHAGLPPQERRLRQQQWLKNEARVMTATNAFGMGIDKPDVRFVVHVDLPDSPEAYFQEAGRAGRDGQAAGALLYWNKRDIEELKRQFEASFPSLDEIRRTYQALANMYEIPVGAGAGVTVVLDIPRLCATYKLEQVTVFNSLKFLEREGYIAVSDAVYVPARLKVLVKNEILYRFEVANPAYESLLKTILRSYGGLFEEFVPIREKDIAFRTNKSEAEVQSLLKDLDQKDLISYLPQNDKPLLTFLLERMDAKKLTISPENLTIRKKLAEERMNAMIDFVTDDQHCRQSRLLAYFGETTAADCGKCDVCKRKAGKEKKIDREQLARQIEAVLRETPKKIGELAPLFPQVSEEELTYITRQMLDAGRIRFNQNHRLVTA